MVEAADALERLTSLNPFDFRAGIWSDSNGALAELVRLNPFDFRAGIWSATGAQGFALATS